MKTTVSVNKVYQVASIPMPVEFLKAAGINGVGDCNSDFNVECKDGKIIFSKVSTPMDIKEEIAYDFLIDWEEELSIRYERTGRMTSCAVWMKNGKIKVGYSRCRPDDKFNVQVGRAIALARALGEKVDPRLVD